MSNEYVGHQVAETRCWTAAAGAQLRGPLAHAIGPLSVIPGLEALLRQVQNQRAAEDAILEAGQRILHARAMTERTLFNEPTSIREYCQLLLAGSEVERFAVLFMDAKCRMIASEVMFEGTLTVCHVYPREIVRAALKHGAESVVLCHNHPSSGDPTPSRADEALTQTLRSALALVDVRVLDHIIVAPGKSLSMAERGLL